MGRGRGGCARGPAARTARTAEITGNPWHETRSPSGLGESLRGSMEVLMRTTRTSATLLFLLIAGSACGNTSGATSVQPEPATPFTARTEPEPMRVEAYDSASFGIVDPTVKRVPDRESWVAAWSLLAERRERGTLDVGDWSLERTREGTFVAWSRVAVTSGDKLPDGVLLNWVNAELAIEGLRGSGMRIGVTERVVEVEGMVDSAAQAADTVRIAMATVGIEKVISDLRWP